MDPIKNDWLERGLSLAAAGVLTLAASACGSTHETGSGGDWTEDDFLGASAPSETAPPDHPEPASNPFWGELEARSNSVAWIRWSKGDPAVTLKPVATHVCGLGMVRGEFALNTTVTIFKSNGNWKMRGDGATGNLLQMDALCEPLSAFSVNAGQTVSVGTEVTAAAGRNGSKVVALPGGTVGIMTGMVGRFEGSGERARVTLAPAVEIKVGDQAGTHQARAVPLSFGISPLQSPYITDEFTPRTLTARACDDFNLCHVFTSREIAPLAANFCYLASVSGDFNGAQEFAQVYPDFARGQWVLAVAANSGNGVTARAECIVMNQIRDGGDSH